MPVLIQNDYMHLLMPSLVSIASRYGFSNVKHDYEKITFTNGNTRVEFLRDQFDRLALDKCWSDLNDFVLESFRGTVVDTWGSLMC